MGPCWTVADTCTARLRGDWFFLCPHCPSGRISGLRGAWVAFVGSWSGRNRFFIGRVREGYNVALIMLYLSELSRLAHRHSWECPPWARSQALLVQLPMPELVQVLVQVVVLVQVLVHVPMPELLLDLVQMKASDQPQRPP
ncbi:unnamed protein product [Boreogadus saida]